MVWLRFVGKISREGEREEGPMVEREIKRLLGGIL